MFCCRRYCMFFFFFKQKTAYEMRISDWSSDVCSSDLSVIGHAYAAFALWARASRARTQKYVVKKAVAATLSSKMMRWGGVALLLFVVFHLLHQIGRASCRERVCQYV